MLLYHKWQELPLATRNKIASAFGIIKKGPTEVFANTIKADGYLIKDIEEALTLGNLQNYLGTTETDFTILWSYLVDKIEGKDIVLIDIGTASFVPPKEEPKTEKKGRPKKTK